MARLLVLQRAVARRRPVGQVVRRRAQRQIIRRQIAGPPVGRHAGQRTRQPRARRWPTWRQPTRRNERRRCSLVRPRRRWALRRRWPVGQVIRNKRRPGAHHVQPRRPRWRPRRRIISRWRWRLRRLLRVRVRRLRLRTGAWRIVCRLAPSHMHQRQVVLHRLRSPRRRRTRRLQHIQRRRLHRASTRVGTMRVRVVARRWRARRRARRWLRISS